MDKINKPRSSFLCHRLPDRTFKIKDHYFPVCSRCTGLYMGVFSCFIISYFIFPKYGALIALTSILIMIPAFLDAITQYYGLRKSNNLLRFLTGLIAGFGLLILIKSLKWTLIN